MTIGFTSYISTHLKDPKDQILFHKWMSYFWLALMVAIPFVTAAYSHSIGVLVLLEISLYANFTSDLGGMSAAQAAFNSITLTDPSGDDVVTLS